MILKPQTIDICEKCGRMWDENDVEITDIFFSDENVKEENTILCSECKWEKLKKKYDYTKRLEREIEAETRRKIEKEMYGDNY